MHIDLGGTPNKSRLGANAIIGVSIVMARGTGDAGGSHARTDAGSGFDIPGGARCLIRLPMRVGAPFANA